MPLLPSLSGTSLKRDKKKHTCLVCRNGPYIRKSPPVWLMKQTVKEAERKIDHYTLSQLIIVHFSTYELMFSVSRWLLKSDYTSFYIHLYWPKSLSRYISLQMKTCLIIFTLFSLIILKMLCLYIHICYICLLSRLRFHF